MNEIQPNLLSFGVIDLTLGVVISALKLHCSMAILCAISFLIDAGVFQHFRWSVPLVNYLTHVKFV